MKVIIGLGNPGERYQFTRHNAGYLVIDGLQKKWGFGDFSLNRRFQAEISKGKGYGGDILLAKPATYMNNSGDSVRFILDFYKLSANDIIVIQDDIDLPLGKLKIATDSGAAGHNGIQDIIEKIGTKKFIRIRIGIANEKIRTVIDPSDFVIQRFSESEIEQLEILMDDAMNELEKMLCR